MNDIDAALKEAERAIKQLKFKGIQLSTPSRGKAIDRPEYMELYALMAEYNLPIWIHPRTTPSFANYSTESASKYRIWHVFGWTYHTTAAMTRLIFSGIFERYPDIKIITHHAGAMVPFFDKRIEVLYNTHGQEDKKLLRKSPLEYFKMFYADTAVNGSTPALECAHKFFGTNHMLLGTDTPHDLGKGEISLRDTILSIERMNISQSDKQAMFEDNARKLLGLDLD